MDTTKHRGSGLVRAGKIVFAIGVVLILVSIGLLVKSWVDLDLGAEDSDTAFVDLNAGQGVLQVGEGESIYIYDNKPEPRTPAACTVQGPNGAKLESVLAASDAKGEAEFEVGEYVPSVSGKHTINCTGGGALTAIAVKGGSVVPMGMFVGGIFGAAISTLIAIIGAVLWLIGANMVRTDKREKQAQQTGYYDDQPL